MVLDKKQIPSIFVLGFKMGSIGVKTTHNINDAFGPGTANKHTVQWWFKNFCKGDESLEDKEHSGRPSEGDKEQPRAKADPLPATGEGATKLDVIILRLFGTCSKLEGEKAAMTSAVFGQEAPKHLPKPNLYQKKKKVLVTVWWSATCLVYYSFLYPCETITSEKCAQQIDEMHQKLQCLQPALVNRKGPVLLSNNAQLHLAQPTLQKFN